MTQDNDLTTYYFLRYKTGKTSLKVMRNNKSLAKRNKQYDHYIALSTAIAMVEVELNETLQR